MTKYQWPPRSPDLNPCDYFLYGYLKSKLYKPFPKILDDLKEKITREIQKINTSVLESTFLNLTKRCNLLILKKMEGILIKKKILTTQFPFSLSLKWCIGLKNRI